MSDSQDILQQVKSAIIALGSRQSNGLESDAWLVSFEKSRIAWEIAHALLLDDSNSMFRFFGAKFLYSKSQKQFFQLESDSSAKLTQMILQHIIRLSAGGAQNLEMNVCRYLCLSVATLALQSNTPGIVHDILMWLNPVVQTCPLVLLEFLIILPEEAFNRHIDVSSHFRELFVKQLTDSSQEVLTFISTLWTVAKTNERSKLLICAEKWIGITHLSANVLQSQPIYSYILQSLQSQKPEDEDNFEAAVDALLAILYNFRTSEQQILDATLPVVLSLRSLWREKMNVLAAARNENDQDIEVVNVCRVLCRLFSETAENCMNMFIDDSVSTNLPSLNQQYSEALIHQLLECAQFPYSSSDANICKMPMKFFYELSLAIHCGGSNTSEENNHHNHSYDNINGEKPVRVNGPNHSLINKYIPVFQCLLEISVTQMMIPETVMMSNIAIPDDVLDIRGAWKETVLDCSLILGGVTSTGILCKMLQMEVEACSNSHNNANTSNSTGSGGAIAARTMNYCRVESLLFGVQLVSPWLPREEDRFIAPLIEFLGQLSAASHLLHLQVTAIELYGLLSFWFESHPQQLQAVMQRLVLDLNHPQTSSAAALTLMHIMRQCSNVSGLPVAELHSHIMRLRSTFSLSLEAEIHMLEGIAVVISSPNSSGRNGQQSNPTAVAESENSFRLIVSPMLEELQAVLQTPSVQATQLVPSIDRLTAMFRYFHTEGSCVVDLLVALIPIFKQVLQVQPSEKICERICRCYKQAIRNTGGRFLPYLPAFTAHLAEQFAANPVAAFLYAASVVVGEFSSLRPRDNNPIDMTAVAECLYGMVWSMSSVFFGRFSSLEQFEQKPDVVEEYFFLMAKALQSCPTPFITSTNGAAQTVIQAAISGLALKHREAQKGVLLFFERLLQLVSYWAADSPLNIATRALVGSYGAVLLQALFTMLSGQMPAYALDENNGCISDVLWYLRKRFPADFETWFRDLLPRLSEEAQAIARQQELYQSLCDKHATQKSFGAALDRYENSCRANTC